jgi:hypothetical protein
MKSHSSGWWLFGAYLSCCLIFGELFPFSRFKMYSDLSAGPAAVPVMRANGQLANPADFKNYTGLDTPLPAPPAPCSMGYRQEELKLAIERNRGAEAGPVQIELGWLVVGETEGSFVAGASGWAWPR